MKKRKLGRNRGIWCGKIVTNLELNHELQNKEKTHVIERFFKFFIETEVGTKDSENEKASVLPVIISETKLKEFSITPKKGDIVFLKGPWRTYDKEMPHSNRTKLEQYIFVKQIEVHEEFSVKTRNKIEFKGVLVDKIFVKERDENGHMIKKNGKFVNVLDENEKPIPTTRKKDGKIINDFTVAVNRPNGSDYIPAVASFKLAEFIAYQLEIGAEIECFGYTRSREYELKSNGQVGIAYEAVINRLNVIEPEEKSEK